MKLTFEFWVVHWHCCDCHTGCDLLVLINFYVGTQAFIYGVFYNLCDISAPRPHNFLSASASTSASLFPGLINTHADRVLEGRRPCHLRIRRCPRLTIWIGFGSVWQYRYPGRQARYEIVRNSLRYCYQQPLGHNENLEENSLWTVEIFRNDS